MRPARNTTAAAQPPAGSGNPAHLIYLDTDRATVCIERLAATHGGRHVLGRANCTIERGNIVKHFNPAQLLTDIEITSTGHASDLAADTPLDLDKDPLYPGQVIAIRGRIRTGTDVLPASVLLHCAQTDIRVLVDRAHGLHLNQSFLTDRTICAIGTVQSVPRRQLRAAALFA